MIGTLHHRNVNGVRVHTYTGGKDGYLVNTHIIEGQSQLVVF